MEFFATTTTTTTTTKTKKITQETRLATAECDDGTEDVSETKELEFLEWLRDHGAVVDKLEWPSRATTSGVRGAVAREDIEAGEPMLEIPQKLMIYPAVCLACEALQPVYHAKWRFFQSDDDLIIAVFLMHERLQGKDSFWFPYLQILPVPGGIGEWTHEEQLELQDRDLVAEARRRPGALKRLYLEVEEAVELAGLNTRQYSFDLFKWAWMVIQSRAFGRRLPWTAMVPFADCLNHNNVQVKYALAIRDGHSEKAGRHGTYIKQNGDVCAAVVERKVDEAIDRASSGAESQSVAIKTRRHGSSCVVVDDDDDDDDDSGLREGSFRLFPTGTNRYARGEEAFNSYGRRSNSFLLLEYGFCLEDNEWDTYKLTVRLDPGVAEYEAKCAILRAAGMPRYKSFRLERGRINEDLVAFMRLAALEGDGVRLALAAAVDAPRAVPLRDLVARAFGGGGSADGDGERERELVGSAALAAVAAAAEAELARQASTPAQDAAALAAAPGPRLRAALLYRAARKEILRDQAAIARSSIARGAGP